MHYFSIPIYKPTSVSESSMREKCLYFSIESKYFERTSIDCEIPNIKQLGNMVSCRHVNIC